MQKNKKHIYTDLNDRINKLESVLDASKAIHSILNLDDLLSAILSKSIECIGAERGTIYLIDNKKDVFWSKVQTGEEKLTIELPLGVGIAGHVAKTGKTVNVKDTSKDSRFYEEIDNSSGFTTKNMLCMPLKNRKNNILGVFQLLNKNTGGHFTQSDEEFIEAFSIHASIAIEKARLYDLEKQKADIEKELFAAGEVQKKLFPSEIPNVPGYQLAAINIPARQTSGDLYDLTPLEDGKMAFCLGDVSGKGLPAALIMANLQSLLHTFPQFNSSPSYCVAKANRIIEKATSEKKFITLFFGILDPVNHKITYTNAGHESPFFIHNGFCSQLSEGGLPAGIFENAVYDEKDIDLHPGDLLVVFSDGIADATNASGHFFTEERLKQLILKYLNESPQKIIEIVSKEVADFTAGEPQFDDITLCIIKREKQ